MSSSVISPVSAISAQNIDLSQNAEAYHKVLPELRALSPAELRRLPLDLRKAVTTALGVAHTVTVDMLDVLRGAHGFDGAVLARLADYARAADHADALHTIATLPPNELPELREEATALRSTLLTTATLLTKRGHLPEGALDNLSGAVGHHNLAADLRALVSLFQAHGAAPEVKRRIKESDLVDAEALADRIRDQVSLRGRDGNSVAEASDLRLRALTLLVRSYDRVRRWVVFARWEHGDADTIAPSLYAGRVRKAKEKAPVSDDAPGVAPAAPAAPAVTATPASGATG